jgi:hypothetical protein
LSWHESWGAGWAKVSKFEPRKARMAGIAKNFIVDLELTLLTEEVFLPEGSEKERQRG